MELAASHEPVPALVLDLAPGGESKSKSRIKSKTTRFMGIMHGKKTVDAAHERPSSGSAGGGVVALQGGYRC
jgi:hypothetical protein